jgi:hypothetical protein
MARFRMSLIARRVVVALLAFAIVEYGVVAAMPSHVDLPGTSHSAPADVVASADSTTRHHHRHGAHEQGSVAHVHVLSAFLVSDGVRAPLPSEVSTEVRLARNDATLYRATPPPLRPPRTSTQA